MIDKKEEIIIQTISKKYKISVYERPQETEELKLETTLHRGVLYTPLMTQKRLIHIVDCGNFDRAKNFAEEVFYSFLFRTDKGKKTYIYDLVFVLDKDSYAVFTRKDIIKWLREYKKRTEQKMEQIVKIVKEKKK